MSSTISQNWKKLGRKITECERCPRLRSHCEQTALVKKREFRQWDYWGKPVPGFGEPDASVWIVGLAPAAHGANRTGRMFTGDSSGNWLYRALFEVGLASQAESSSREDGLLLKDVYISAAARCAPPDNKPTREELLACRSYLDIEWQELKANRIILVLGKIAFDTIWDLAKMRGVVKGARPAFQHGGEVDLGGRRLLMSYHPSRQNTNTGKLTWKMWSGIFYRLNELRLENHSPGKR